MNVVYCFCDFETTGLFDFKQPDKVVYPIEVGLIFTDKNYVIYDIYEELILWPDLYDEMRNINQWPDFSIPAYNVHKISPIVYLENSLLYMNVAGKIYNKINNLKSQFKSRTRFILLSDNIQFEFKLMEILLREFAIKEKLDWPFHYCGYDSSEFLIKTGIGDPKPEHRALRDAALLHQHMIRALEKIK